MKRALIKTRIYTGARSAPFAEALLMEDGIITRVGTTEKILSGVTPDTQITSLSGHLVVPGLVDAHSHFVGYGLNLTRVNLAGLPSMAACREAIQKAVEKAEPGSWVLGRGWNHHFWEEKAEPTKGDLDDISPDHPLVMTRACGHLIWVNSKALEVAGVTKETVTPEGGQIDRDADGNPTGIIRECLEVIRQHIPEVTLSERKEAIRKAQKRSLACGITGMHSCETLADFHALKEMESEGELKLRICHLLPPEEQDEADSKGITAGSGSDHLWHTHIKLFLDGSLGAETAWMLSPYEGTDHCGLACMSEINLHAAIEAAYRSGRSVAVHAIGDRAVRGTLDAIEEVRKTCPGKWRDRIEHVQRIAPEDIHRMKEMHVTASVQPGFLPTDWQTAEAKWGKERCRTAYAWKTLLSSGIPVQFGSDVPVEPNDPLIGIRAAMERTDSNEKPEGGWLPDEKLTFWEAIDGYTRVAAWTAGKEAVSGTIEPGKWADFTVFDRSFENPEEDIRKARVVKTIIAGRDEI